MSLIAMLENTFFSWSLLTHLVGSVTVLTFFSTKFLICVPSIVSGGSVAKSLSFFPVTVLFKGSFVDI